MRGEPTDPSPLASELQRVIELCSQDLNELLEQELADGHKIQNLIGIIFNGSDPAYKIGVLTREEVRQLDLPSMADEELRDPLTSILNEVYANTDTVGLYVVVTVDTVYGAMRIFPASHLSPGGQA